MFYVASKLFFAISRPYHLALLLLILGVAGLYSRWSRAARRLVTGVLVGLVLLSFGPVPQWLIQPLEARFPRPETLPVEPDGIIILGGGFDVLTEAGHGDFISLNDAAERMTEIPALAKTYPRARILYTGGPAEITLAPDLKPEAESARRLLIEAGIAPERITIEGRSLTTWENATFTRDLVRPEPGSHWLIVTSAFHMARSMGVFRAAGWPGVMAFPTDYRAPAAGHRVRGRMIGVENLMISELAVKEYIGLVAYWLSGRSTALFPAP